MESKYSGKCTVCETAWKEGETIFYSKDPKVICTNEECFKEQGGTVSEYKPFAKSGGSFSKGYAPARTLEQKLSDINVLDEQLSKIATERLQKLEESIGQLEASEKLVFVESWARTLATSFNQR